MNGRETTLTGMMKKKLLLLVLLFFMATSISSSSVLERTLLARTKRTTMSNMMMMMSSRAPCPVACTCHYDVISCNDLIDSCVECAHWRQIEFVQIGELGARAFERFRFASNRTTSIVIYKLLNGTIRADAFDGFRVPDHAQVEIVFQYNSMIRLDRHALRGLTLQRNSTVIFNFPYTTQVMFVSKCFDGVRMESASSRLVIRILKSFSVRFVSDMAASVYNNNNNKNSNDKSSSLLLNTLLSSSTSRQIEPWTIERGTFIVDIKATHLVKFEDYSLSSMQLLAGARFFLDLEQIEKLMFQRHSFGDMNVRDGSRTVIYAKQITFIDFRAFSFASLSIVDVDSRVEVYLEELTSSLCLQRNVFSHMRVRRAGSFNFSVIDSKNVQLMHDSFSNLTLDDDNSLTRVHVGVYNTPSYLLSFYNQNYYRRFLNDRYEYLSQASASNAYSHGYHNHLHHHHHFMPQNYPSSNDFFYHRYTAIVDASSDSSRNPDRFYLLNKQTYSYNLSIERNVLANLTTPTTRGVTIVCDNINTLLVDNFMVNSTAKTDAAVVNFVLNVRHFILYPESLAHVSDASIEFVREPAVVKLGVPSVNENRPIVRTIRLNGLSLTGPTHSVYSRLANNSNQNFDYFDYSTDSSSDFMKYNSPSEGSGGYSKSTSALIDGLCELASSKYTRVRVSPSTTKATTIPCTCQIVQLYANQLDKSNTNVLPCQLPSDPGFVESCLRTLRSKCNSGEGISQALIRNYVRFWEFCISEPELKMKPSNSKTNNGGDSSNGLYGFDGLFSSSSSSSLSLGSSPYYDSANEDTLGSGIIGDPDFFFKSSSSLDSSSSSNQTSWLSSSSSSSENSSSQPSNSVFKTVFTVILCSIIGIGLFMIAVNIIQYKFRDDLLDDYDFNSTNNKNLNCKDDENGGGGLLSSSSLSPPGPGDNGDDDSSRNNNYKKRAAQNNMTMMPTLPEYSSQADELDDDDESSEDSRNNNNNKNYNSPEFANNNNNYKPREKNANSDSYFVEDEGADGDYDEDDDDEEQLEDEEMRRNEEYDEDEDYVEEENNNRRLDQVDEDEEEEDDEYAVSRPLKKDSGDSSGIASNNSSNNDSSDHTIVSSSSPVMMFSSTTTTKTTNSNNNQNNKYKQVVVNGGRNNKSVRECS